MNGSGWQQLLAALLAAVVPVLVKIFNDWHDRVTADRATAAASTPGPGSTPYDQAAPAAPVTKPDGDNPAGNP